MENLIIDDREAGLFRVNRQAFRSPEILSLEHERVFERCWIYAGHESEIPQPGDFCSRRVAGRPVIFARGSDGQVRVLLNTCTHRGTLVCREQRGNARTFQCPYHAWTYNNCGELVGVPVRMPIVQRSTAKSLGLAVPAADGNLSWIHLHQLQPTK